MSLYTFLKEKDRIYEGEVSFKLKSNLLARRSWVVVFPDLLGVYKNNQLEKPVMLLPVECLTAVTNTDGKDTQIEITYLGKTEAATFILAGPSPAVNRRWCTTLTQAIMPPEERLKGQVDYGDQLNGKFWENTVGIALANRDRVHTPSVVQNTSTAVTRQVILQGPLKKRSPRALMGQHFNQERHFILYQDALMYFKKKDEPPAGCFMLADMARISANENRIDLYVRQDNGERHIVLLAATDVEANVWLEKITRAKEILEEGLAGALGLHMANSNSASHLAIALTGLAPSSQHVSREPSPVPPSSTQQQPGADAVVIASIPGAFATATPPSTTPTATRAITAHNVNGSPPSSPSPSSTHPATSTATLARPMQPLPPIPPPRPSVSIAPITTTNNSAPVKAGTGADVAFAAPKPFRAPPPVQTAGLPPKPPSAPTAAPYAGAPMSPGAPSGAISRTNTETRPSLTPANSEGYGVSVSVRKEEDLSMTVDDDDDDEEDDEDYGTSSHKKSISMRSLVSKKKKRFNKDGFDLDLTYITSQIIAMGFPSDGFEAMYRNPMPQVQQFFKAYHSNHYKVYNLCSERSYDLNCFEKACHDYPFDDHNPCPFRMILSFCEDAKAFLDQDPKNVVAIHCKAGKGRTGLMICALLLFLGGFPSAHAVLDYYGKQRTYNGKGVTIPSQIRWVHQFDQYLRVYHFKGLTMPPTDRKVILRGYELGPSSINYDIGAGGCDPYLIVRSMATGKKDLYNSRKDKTCKSSHDHWLGNMPFCSSVNCELQGEVQLIFMDYDAIGSDDKMFSVWLQTSYISEHKVILTKNQCDGAVKDKKNEHFPPSFYVTLFFDYDEEPDLPIPVDMSTSTATPDNIVGMGSGLWIPGPLVPEWDDDSDFEPDMGALPPPPCE